MTAVDYDADDPLAYQRVTGTELRTFSGREVDLMRPDPEKIDLGDIARSLSMLCRFNGHVQRARPDETVYTRDGLYSVAEHSVRVSWALRAWKHDQSIQRLGLLHDAAEAYLGDVTSPVKVALRCIDGTKNTEPSAFDLLERMWLVAIGKRFGVQLLDRPPEIVKVADLSMLRAEDIRVRGLTGLGMPDGCQIGTRMGSEYAERAFLERARELGIR